MALVSLLFPSPLAANPRTSSSVSPAGRLSATAAAMGHIPPIAAALARCRRLKVWSLFSFVIEASNRAILLRRGAGHQIHAPPAQGRFRSALRPRDGLQQTSFRRHWNRQVHEVGLLSQSRQRERNRVPRQRLPFLIL